MPFFSEAASMLKVASSTSTKTGVAPVSATASPVAQKVKEGQITASPRPMFFAINTINSASVPLAQLTTCLAPENSASRASSSVTSGPLMNWQWVSTRATASSIDLTSRRRCAPMSIKGTGSRGVCWFMEPSKSKFESGSADDAARAFASRGGRGWPGRGFQATDGDFEAGDAFVAGHRGHAAAANGTEERDQFGTQRFVMSDRQMTHRIAA